MLPTWMGRFASRVPGTSCDFRFTLAPALALAGSVAMVTMPRWWSNEHALKRARGRREKRAQNATGRRRRALAAKGASLRGA